jgi:hypothetical protein
VDCFKAYLKGLRNTAENLRKYGQCIEEDSNRENTVYVRLLLLRMFCPILL